MSPRLLSDLHNLTNLIILCRRGVDNLHGYKRHELEASVNGMSQLIDSNSSTLRRLCIYASLLPGIRPHVWRNLVEFEMWGDPADLGNLHAVLKHAENLESLVLVELTSIDVLLLLGQHVSSLPRLASLKLMLLDINHDGKGLKALASFLRERPGLRYLDLDLPGSDRGEIIDILALYTNSQQLEVFGMDVRSLMDEEDIILVANHLPPSLCSLHLQLCWEASPILNHQWRYLVCLVVRASQRLTHNIGQIEQLGRMNKLHLLHLQTVQSALLDEIAEELVYALPQLEFLLLGNTCFHIDNTKQEPTFAKWSDKRLAFRTDVELGFGAGA
jgi:hypothetical protein